MTWFQKIKAMTEEELIDYLYQYVDLEDAPWWKWFGENYCQGCEPVEGTDCLSKKKMLFSYCEFYGECRFFSGQDLLSDGKKTVQKWLESEVEQHGMECFCSKYE